MKRTRSRGRGPLKALKLPAIHEAKLSNGLGVQVVRRGPLPLVAIRLVLQTGASSDPAGKHGLADFTVRLLRRGTARLSADALNEAVEFVGASLAAGVSEDATSIGITAPAEHLDAMMDVLGQLVLEPAFPAEEVETARGRVLAQIANDLDDPGALADRAFVRGAFGTHPYGHEISGQRSHVASFTRDEVVAFHRARFGPAIARLIIVGAVDPDGVVTAAERAFGGFHGGPTAPDPVPPLTSLARAGRVLVVHKPEQTQTQVRVGAPGITRSHPDYFPVHVVNTVLGGGFTSRLMKEIRVKRGLSYGASCHFDAMKAAGIFTLSSFTKTGSTRQLLDVALGVVAGMRGKGPTARELETAQRYVCGLYPLRLETNESISSALAEIFIYGLPADRVEKFRDRVAAVTRREAAAAARAHLFERSPLVALAGNADEIEPLVSGLGTVERIAPAELE